MPKWLEKIVSYLPFNQGNTKVQLGVAVVIALILIASCTVARAGDGYVAFGAGTTTIRGPAPVIDLSISYPNSGPGDAGYEIGATFIGISTLNGEDQAQNYALRAALVDGFGHFDVGIGVAYLQNVDTYNGSHSNFTLLFGYRFQALPLTLRVEHFSNGGTQSPNKGRDMVWLAYRFEGSAK
jgi:hypothetical protein